MKDRLFWLVKHSSSTFLAHHSIEKEYFSYAGYVKIYDCVIRVRHIQWLFFAGFNIIFYPVLITLLQALNFHISSSTLFV